MDILSLLSVAYSGNKEERTKAAAQLEEACQSSAGLQCLVTLLRAGTDPALPTNQSLLALIYAKNYITQTLTDEQVAAAPEVLEEVKLLLYNGVFRVPVTHQRIILTSVSTLISAFEWNYIPQILPEITRDRADVPVEQALASLRMLYVYIKRFKVPTLEPMPMKLPTCSCLLKALPSFLSYRDWEVDHIVLKAMECVVETALQTKDVREFQPEALDPWFCEMAQYPERHFAEAREAAAGGSTKVYETYIRCLKRIAMISFSVLNSATRKKKPFPVPKRFLTLHAATFFGVWQRWLEHAASSGGQITHQKADIFAIRYIKLCTLDKHLYQQSLFPQLPHLFESILFPFLCLNEEDDVAFAEGTDLSEFTQYMLEEGFELSEVSRRQAASNAILALVKGERDFHENCLQKIIDFLTAGLSREDNKETVSQTFGFLHLLSILRRHLRKVPEIWGTQMAQVLMTFVAPRILPTVPFVQLRCKALVVCQRYSKAPIPSEEQFASLVQLVCSLLQDTDSRVRLGAVDAICTLLEMKRAVPYIRPFFLPLVEECIVLLDRVQTSFVPAALFYLTKHFAAELTPMLAKIGTKLVQHFLAAVFDLNQQEAADDCDVSQYWRADINACALLEALDTIVVASRHHVDMFCNIRSDVLFLARRVLESPDSIEFMEKTLGILLNVINFSKPIPPDCWNFLPLLFQSVDSGFGVDCFVGIEEVLDSYVSNGTVEYLQNPDIMEATYRACDKILFNPAGGVEEKIAVPQLIEAMLHQAKHCEAAPGLFDAHLSRFVSLLLRALVNDTIIQGEARLQTWIIAALMDSFYYNAAATLQIITGHNANPQFFDGILNYFRRAINPHEGQKKGKRGKRRKGIDDAQEAVRSLSILTRKVMVLGLTALLEQLTADNANNNNNNGTGGVVYNLDSFDGYLAPTLALIQHCIFSNDALLASRCRITEKNLEKLRQGIEEEDVEDVDLDDGDVLGIDDCSDEDDVATEEEGDDDDDDANEDDEVGHCPDEGDDYESPIDDVCEVTLFLQWVARATVVSDRVGRHAQTALSKSLQEFRDAEETALRYRRLVRELDCAMESDSKARSSAAVTL